MTRLMYFLGRGKGEFGKSIVDIDRGAPGTQLGAFAYRNHFRISL